MRSDPTDNGGLFVGRRPGTAPVHSASCPSVPASAAREPTARWRTMMLAAMVVLSLLCWGPIPVACLWIGSQINYLTGA